MAKIVLVVIVSGVEQKAETFNFPDNEGAQAHFDNLESILKDTSWGYIDVKIDGNVAEFGISEEIRNRVRLELEE